MTAAMIALLFLVALLLAEVVALWAVTFVDLYQARADES